MIWRYPARSFHASGMSSPDANARPRTKERSPAWRVRPDCGNFGGFSIDGSASGCWCCLCRSLYPAVCLLITTSWMHSVNPKRWTVSGPQLALLPAQYIAAASAVVAANETVTGVRFPRSAGAPVVVLARQQVDPESGRRPRSSASTSIPPTGAVLDKVDFRASWVGFLHVFHENLTIPQYSGRQIVGWAGVGMPIFSLTGIWLWWPRRASVLSGLRWRRAPHTSTNLHHTLGFWISIPLAIVSLTGIHPSFPQTARSLMSSIAPMQPAAAVRVRRGDRREAQSVTG